MKIVKLIKGTETRYVIQDTFLYFFTHYLDNYTRHWHLTLNEAWTQCRFATIQDAQERIDRYNFVEGKVTAHPLYDTKVEEAIYADRTDEEPK